MNVLVVLNFVFKFFIVFCYLIEIMFNVNLVWCLFVLGYWRYFNVLVLVFLFDKFWDL